MATEKIRIAVRKFAPFESALAKLWQHYCETTGCTLQAEMVPMDLDDLHASTIAEKGLQNGDWDIAHIVTDWLFEAWQAGALEDLQPYVNHNPPEDYPSGWSQSLLTMQQFDGALAGLPFHDGPECLIYRKDLFEDPAECEDFAKQYGRPLTVPTNWDDFKQIARFFNRPKHNLYGALFAGFPDGHNAVFDFCLQLWTRGGTLVDNHHNININTPQAAEGLSFYREILCDNTAVHPKSMQYESVQSGMAFARGEAAMMVNWFGFAAMCELIDESDIKGKVDIAAIPSGKDCVSASLNVYWLYTIGSGSKHKQTAYDFLRFAINRQNDKLLTLEGGIGCRISTWNDADVNNIIPFYHKLEQLHHSAKMLPQSAHWSHIAKVIDEVVLQATNSGLPVDNLLAAGQKNIDSIINKTNYGYTL